MKQYWALLDTAPRRRYDTDYGEGWWEQSIQYEGWGDAALIVFGETKERCAERTKFVLKALHLANNIVQITQDIE